MHVHNCCVFWSLNVSSSHTEQVLRRIQVLEKELLVSKGAKLPHPKKTAAFCRYLLAFHMILVFGIWLFNGLRIHGIFTYGCGPWAEEIAGFSLQAARCFGIQISYEPAVWSTMSNIAVALPYALSALLYTYHWTMGLALNTLWGISFAKLFRSCTRIYFLTLLAKEIQKFNQISGAMDCFNIAFGSMILGLVVSGGSYYAIFITEIFEFDSNPSGAILTLITFMFYLFALLAAAEVNRARGEMKKVLKSRFTTSAPWRQIRPEDAMETESGLMMLFMELSNGSIGFEGLGFFTLTYFLIGSVASFIMTMTYACVSMQIS